MSPTKEEIEEANAYIDSNTTNGIYYGGPERYPVILAAALRASEARYALFERHYKEAIDKAIDTNPLDFSAYSGMLLRHLREREALE